MAGRSPASILYDADGNPVEVTLDGGVYRLEQISKSRNSSGTIINPATEDTLATRASESTLSTRATETTLDAIRDNIGEAVTTPATDTLLDRLVTIITTLTSIKDTDGVQIIDDIIRLGDTARNGINSVLNNAIRRLEARASLTSADGTKDISVTAADVNRIDSTARLTDGTNFQDFIQDTDNGNVWRAQVEALTAPGSIVNIGTGIPSNPSDLVLQFCVNGGSSNMLVNGSVTPVNFDFNADPTDDLALNSLLMVFAADDFEFDGVSFGPNASLTNGVRVETTIGGVTTEIFNIQQNEDFLRIPGRPPIVNNTGPKDILAASFGFGGIVKLGGGTSDRVRLIVRDNLTSVKFKYLTATIYATKD